MIYSFLNQKGGVGKTTLSLHTAAELAKRKRKVLLIDADPQGSAIGWSSCRTDATFDVIAYAKPNLHNEIQNLAANYDDVVIDGPPRVTELARSILLATDIVVIPVQPSPMDVWATVETVDLVTEAQLHKPELKCALVVNRRIVNSAIGRDVRKALKQLNVPVLKTDLGQRVLFAETVAGGRTVLDHSLSKAAAETRKFVKELRRIK